MKSDYNFIIKLIGGFLIFFSVEEALSLGLILTISWKKILNFNTKFIPILVISYTRTACASENFKSRGYNLDRPDHSCT